jgi:hypothetical protein
MNNRDRIRFKNIGAVKRGAREFTLSSVSDLVVSDNMDSTVEIAIRGSMEGKGFVDYSLPTDSGVSVDSDVHH